MHQSVATIDSPEFLNLEPLDINPLMSKCEIKVFYIGANRNHSFIDQNVAKEIGKTLRGAPIVGFYRDSKEDFTDHGEKVIIDDEGIKFQCQTVPYGFVSPDAKVWFQNFEQNDGMGNSVVRKYLMTTGYLWTGQFPESSLPVNEGRPQSMELESNSVDGHWETNLANGMDYFIINDAVIQKICILGNDVEPCFEGAAVTAPAVSNTFMLDDKFKHTLFSMMQDLQKVLSRGGQNMDVSKNSLEQKTVTSELVEDAFAYEEGSTAKVAGVDITDSSIETSTDFKKNNDEEKEDTNKEQKSSEEKSTDDEENGGTEKEKEEDNEDEEDTAKKKNGRYELLEQELTELKQQYANLQAQYETLVEFKNNIDNQQKDALIKEFYMLSDADKADVIQNKSKYSLEEIKSKLSVICFDKKINFSQEEETADNQKEDSSMATTYNINNDNDNLPEWVREVKRNQSNL